VPSALPPPAHCTARQHPYHGNLRLDPKLRRLPASLHPNTDLTSDTRIRPAIPPASITQPAPRPLHPDRPPCLGPVGSAHRPLPSTQHQNPTCLGRVKDHPRPIRQGSSEARQRRPHGAAEMTSDVDGRPRPPMRQRHGSAARRQDNGHVGISASSRIPQHSLSITGVVRRNPAAIVRILPEIPILMRSPLLYCNVCFVVSCGVTARPVYA
jgi:hypothetical protein